MKTLKISNRSRFSVSVATAVLGVAMISNPAFAQAAAEDEAKADEIVVTGSLIKNPNLEQSSPVGVVTAEEVELRQVQVAEQFLRELPSAVPSIGSAVNNGNGGASFVNLRGIGTNRNIVLLDGQRIAPAGLAGVFDLNNVPLALVERTDILTGGAVTTYGADAISGVVNFITKQDFSGAEINGGFGITEKGDGASFRTDVTIGANFDDGRGNAVFSVGYQEMDPVYQGDRAFSIFNIDSYSGAPGGSGTTVPTRISGTRPLTAAGVPNTTPQFTDTGLTVANPNFNVFKPAGPSNPLVVPVLAATPGGAANGGTRQIVNGQAVAGLTPFNFNPYNIFQTPFSRFNIYGQARYEVSDAVEIYTKGLFSKNTVKTIIAPSGSFGSTLVVPLSNPYLPNTVKDQLCAANIAPVVSGVNQATGAATSGQIAYTPRFTPAQCAAAKLATSPADPNWRTVTVASPRRFVEGGTRDNEYTTQIFNVGAGLRGDITDNISWDVYGSYGESANVSRQTGNGLLSRLNQALNSSNTTTCVVNTNGCVPFNLFGPEGSITPAMLGFVTGVTTSSSTETSLAQVKGLISGETGLTLGNDEAVSFATGAEYRKYRAASLSDLATQTPSEVLGNGAASPDVRGQYSVKEVFGELIVPTFANVTLELGGRYSDYSTAGGSFTWKVGGNWKPIEDIKIRGNYVRGARAPNIGELFSPITTGLTTLATDPCAGAAPAGNPLLRDICVAQGAPLGEIGSIQNPSAAQANQTSGGNPNLDVEKATTWTVGAVVTPQAIPGFSISIDYWNIKVTNAISNPAVGDAIDACFKTITAASATNPACTVIRRNPITGGLDGDGGTTKGLFLDLSNLGRITTDGVDLSLRYKRDVGFAELGLSFDGTWTNSNKFQARAISLNRECVGYMSGNCSSLQPEFVWNQRTSLTFEDKYTISLNWRHLSKIVQEPDDVVQNGPAFAGTLPAGLGVLSGKTVDFGKIGARDYFDLSTRFEISDEATLTMTVTNLLNKQPKVVGSNIGSVAFNSGNVYPSTYDTLGRRYGASIKLRF